MTLDTTKHDHAILDCMSHISLLKIWNVGIPVSSIQSTAEHMRPGCKSQLLFLCITLADHTTTMLTRYACLPGSYTVLRQARCCTGSRCRHSRAWECLVRPGQCMFTSDLQEVSALIQHHYSRILYKPRLRQDKGVHAWSPPSVGDLIKCMLHQYRARTCIE